MTIESLTIRQVRIIREAEIRPAATVNLFIGPNAAGKTSILEAIDILSRGRSFRTSKLERIITRGEQQLLVAARLKQAHGASITLGLERSRGTTRTRIQGRSGASVGELAAYLPVQILHPDSHQLIIGGPAHRRAYVDWGVFHVEPHFLRIWQRYNRALRQRNAAIRAGQSPATVRAWHLDLCETGREINRYRRDYLTAAVPIIVEYTRRIAGCMIEIHYRPGWPDDLDLATTLERELSADLQRGHTRYGPHRADLEIVLDGAPAMLVASRGQQKLLAASLKLAQAQRLTDQAQRHCVFLIDDLPAELEQRYRLAVTQALSNLHAQVFLTAIDAADVDLHAWSSPRTFHVEQGHIHKVI
jgi:DNA replication and repair protein RecF